MYSTIQATSSSAFATRDGPYIPAYRKNQTSSTGDIVPIHDLGPFHMNKTLWFSRKDAEDGLVLGCDEADLYAAGRTVREAMEDHLSELQIAWDNYALADDSELDTEARRYKRWLLANIKGPDI